MFIIDNSIRLSFSLFPERRALLDHKTFHFAFAYKRNKLLAIGQNNMVEKSNKANRLFQHFGIAHPYHYIHAETDVISRLWGRTYIDSSIKFVLIRINKWGALANSKPCSRCSSIFDALGVTKIYWSTNEGKIV